MSKPAKAIPLMLLMCFSSQIKSSDTGELPVHKVELSNRKEDLLKCMIKYNLAKDFEDDRFDNIHNAIRNNFIRRRLTSFLAIAPNDYFTDTNNLFESLLESGLLGKEFLIRPMFLAPKFIDIKKSIIMTTSGLFQDWQKASRLSEDFVENRDILTDNFAIVLSRLSVYLYLLRLSGDPHDLYVKALLEFSINNKDIADIQYCKESFHWIYCALKPYI